MARTPVAQTCESVLATDAELFDQSLITRLFSALEVIQKRTTVVDHLDETAAGILILAVGLEVLCQMLDLLGENGNLNIAGSGIVFMDLELLAD